MVSVIIPHYDNLEGLQQCIANLRTQTLDPSRYEIIVADNNSSCGISAVKRACQGVARVIPAPIPGAAEARNAAIAVARGEVFAFTDQDCRPRPDWLERGVRALDGADVVGGRMVVCVDDRMRVTPTEAFELVFAFNNRRYVERKGFTVNANMFVWRDVFSKVGLFRAGVPEDVDWGYRATALGFRLRYAADAVVEHPARREWTDLIRKWRLISANHYALSRKRRFGKLRFFARSWLVFPACRYPGGAVFRQNQEFRSAAQGDQRFGSAARLAICRVQSDIVEGRYWSKFGVTGEKANRRPARPVSRFESNVLFISSVGL
jgi:glycosyltransferase involved in cell wall biosynthesis